MILVTLIRSFPLRHQRWGNRQRRRRSNGSRLDRPKRSRRGEPTQADAVWWDWRRRRSLLGIAAWFALSGGGNQQNVETASANDPTTAGGTVANQDSSSSVNTPSTELPDTESLTEFNRNAPAQSLVVDSGTHWQPLAEGRVEFGEGSGRKVITPVILDRGNNVVAVSIIHNQTTKVWSGDLAGGESTLLLEHPSPMHLLDHHPESGQSVLWEGLDVLSRGGILRVVTGLATTQPTDVSSKELPGNSKPGFKLAVRWARLVDANTLAAALGEFLYVWDHRKPALLMKAKIGRTEIPAIDPTRRFLRSPKVAGQRWLTCKASVRSDSFPSPATTDPA